MRGQHGCIWPLGEPAIDVSVCVRTVHARSVIKRYLKFTMHRFQPHAATFSTKSDRMKATGFNPGPYNGRRMTRQFLEWRCYTFKYSSYIKYGRIRELMCSFSFALAHNSRACASSLPRRSPPPLSSVCHPACWAFNVRVWIILLRELLRRIIMIFTRDFKSVFEAIYENNTLYSFVCMWSIVGVAD